MLIEDGHACIVMLFSSLSTDITNIWQIVRNGFVILLQYEFDLVLRVLLFILVLYSSTRFITSILLACIATQLIIYPSHTSILSGTTSSVLSDMRIMSEISVCAQIMDFGIAWLAVMRDINSITNSDKVIACV